MVVTQEGTGTETAAERNARLQAAFNKASTSTPTPSAPPLVPAQTASQLFVRRPVAPTAPSVPVVPPLSQTALTQLRDVASGLGFNTFGTTATSGATPTEQAAAQGGGVPTTMVPYSDPAQQSAWQRSLDFVSQGSTRTYEDALVASAARLTGEAIFQYGKIPNVISTAVANQLPYTYYGYSSADAFLEDLGYFEQAPGQWIQGEGGGTTGDGVGDGGGSGTTSYRQALAGGGYTGRYAGATTGLINWRIGF